MKTNYIFLVFFFLIIANQNAFSQGENIFKIGAKWSYWQTKTNYIPDPTNSSQYLNCQTFDTSQLKITKDTVINSKKYFVMLSKTKVIHNQFAAVGFPPTVVCVHDKDSFSYAKYFIRYDTLNKKMIDNFGKLLYDFNSLQVGDTISFLNYTCYKPSVKKIDTIYFNNQLLRRYTVKFDGNFWKPAYENSFFIEGIGGIPSFTSFLPIEFDSISSLSGPNCQDYGNGNLICFQIGDSIFKSNPNAVCIDTLIIPKNVGIEELTTNTDKFKIYPNPTQTGEITLTLQSTETGQAELHISNYMGQSILRKTVKLENNNQWQFDLSKYPSGIYWVSVQTSKEILVKRLVLSKE